MLLLSGFGWVSAVTSAFTSFSILNNYIIVKLKGSANFLKKKKKKIFYKKTFEKI